MGGEDISKAIHGVNINYVREEGFPGCEQGFPVALEAPPVIDGVSPMVSKAFPIDGSMECIYHCGRRFRWHDGRT